MNQQATTVSRSSAPGNANHGVALPVPRATMKRRISAAALVNKTTNAFQPSPTYLSNTYASVRCRHASIPTLPRTRTASGGPLKSP